MKNHNFSLSSLLILFLVAMTGINVFGQNLKQKKIKVYPNIEYRGYVDKEKNLTGSGVVSVNGITEFNYTNVEYWDKKVGCRLSGVTAGLGYWTFHGTIYIDNTTTFTDYYDHKTKERELVTLEEGMLICGNKAYVVDIPIKLPYTESSCNLPEYNLYTLFKRVSDFMELSSFTDADLFSGDSIRLLSKINFRYYKVEPKFIESKKNGLCYTLDNNTKYVSRVDDGKEHYIDFQNHRMNGNPIIIDSLNTFADVKEFQDYKTLGSIYKSLSKSEVHGTGLFIEEQVKDKYYNIFNALKVLTRNGSPVVLPSFSLYKDVPVEAKKRLIEIMSDPDDYEYQIYNLFQASYSWDRGLTDPTITPQKIIFHGKDVTSECSSSCGKFENKAKAQENAEYQARCRKYGKKYVDIREARGVPVVGMPEGLAMEYGLELVEQGSTYSVYEVMGFRCRLTISKGRVSRVWTW